MERGVDCKQNPYPTTHKVCCRTTRGKLKFKFATRSCAPDRRLVDLLWCPSAFQSLASHISSLSIRGEDIYGSYYRDMLLLQQLLPVMRDVSDGFFIFQQDNAPAHRARNTLRSLEHSKPAFIPTDLWLTNSTDMASGINFYSQLVISTIRVSDIANSNY